jgi:hypothetical protein
MDKSSLAALFEDDNVPSSTLLLGVYSTFDCKGELSIPRFEEADFGLIRMGVGVGGYFYPIPPPSLSPSPKNKKERHGKI